MSTLAILNVSDGDTKLSFDPTKPAEVKRACAAVTDMLRRGYAILVEVGSNDKGPLYQRATDFDPATAEYIIVGAPEEAEEKPKHGKPAAAPRRKAGPSKGRSSETVRLPAAKTKAVAVPRTAGG